MNDTSHDTRLGPASPDTQATRAQQLLGRDAEVAEALDMLGTSPVEIVGEPGMGVSTVLGALAGHWVAGGGNVVSVQVTPWSHGPVDLVSQVDALLRARERQLVVVDDAHLTDEDVLDRLLGEVEAAGGSLLVGTHTHPTLGRSQPVRLPGLPRSAICAMLADALGRDVAPDDLLASALARAARGNPSHVAALLEPELLPGLVRMAAPGSDPADLVTPFAAVLSRTTSERLSRLSEGARMAVAVVSGAGPYAPDVLLEAAAGVEQLREAREHGLLRRERDGSHRFRHAVVRELVARSVPTEVRVEAGWRLAVASQATGLTVAPRSAFNRQARG